MATDKSQNMDVFAKQELGWVVPQVLEPGTATTVTDWQRLQARHRTGSTGRRRTARRTR